MSTTIPKDIAEKLDTLHPGISECCFTAKGKLNEIGKLLIELYGWRNNTKADLAKDKRVQHYL